MRHRPPAKFGVVEAENQDRKSTRLNSSHQIISYAVFCLKKKKNKGNSDAKQQLNYSAHTVASELAPDRRTHETLENHRTTARYVAASMMMPTPATVRLCT